VDKERSFYEAHVPDPLAIYEDIATNTKFKNKIKSEKRPLIDDYFELYGTKQLRDEARSHELKGTPREEVRKKHRESHHISDPRNSKITIRVMMDPYPDFNENIRYDTTVKQLKKQIKNRVDKSEDFRLYHGTHELTNDSSILYDLGIGNHSEIRYVPVPTPTLPYADL
jgi:hypothetical protein